MDLKEMTLEEIYDSFDILEDWEQKYMFIIDLGKMLPELDPKYKIDDNLVEGCVSKAWLIKHVSKNGDTKIKYEADSESQIVKGLIALLMITFSDRSPEEILNTDIEEIFTRLDLEANLSGNRANGLRAMVKRIQNEAKEVA